MVFLIVITVCLAMGRTGEVGASNIALVALPVWSVRKRAKENRMCRPSESAENVAN